MNPVRLLYICLLFCFITSIGSPEAIENSNFKKYDSFEKLEDGNLITYRELSTWANHNGLELCPDKEDYGLNDSIGRFVPENGFSFYLVADPDDLRPIFLYLDLSEYKLKPNKLKFPSRGLKIRVNGNIRKRLRFPDPKQKYPIEIVLDPSELLSGGRIDVDLIPFAGDGGFWAIWDAFFAYTSLSQAKSQDESASLHWMGCN